MARRTGGPKDWTPHEGACFRELRVKDWLEGFVKLGYGDLFGLPIRSLDFRTERLKPKDGARVIRLIPGQDKLANAVLELGDQGFIDHIEFGREGSEVVYLHVPFWAGPGQALTEEEIGFAKRAVMEAMEALGADELEETAERSNIIRAWWD